MRSNLRYWLVVGGWWVASAVRRSQLAANPPEAIGDVFFGPQKAPAAAGKTLPRLAKSQGRHLGLQKGACGRREDRTKTHIISGVLFWATK